MHKWMVLLVLVAFGVGGLLLWQAQPRQVGSAADPAAAAAPPEPVRGSPLVVVDGKVLPVAYARLSFGVGGIVGAVLVEEGEQVVAGQVLARLENTRQQMAVAEARAQLERARASLAEVMAGSRPEERARARGELEAALAQRARLQEGPLPVELESARASLDQSRRRLAELLAASGEGSAPVQHRQEVAAAQAQVAAAEARLAQLQEGPSSAAMAEVEAQVRQARAQLELLEAGPRPEAVAAARAEVAVAEQRLRQAEVALRELELQAPFAGTVAALDLRPGEFVAPGMPVMYLADNSGWRIETEDLTELAVVRISEGAPVTIAVDALPDLQLTGRVTGIEGVGRNHQGDVVYTAAITPDRHEPRLRWNMTVSVTIQPQDPAP